MRAPSCESDLTFDRLLAGDLAEPDERRVRDHLAACASCADRRAEIVARRASFEAAPRAIALGERLVQTPRGRRRWLGAAAAVAAAAAAVLLLVVLPGRGDPPAATARTKGDETFQLYIRHGARVRKAGHTEVVYPSDQLQLVYSSRSPGYAAVLSRDGAGVVSVYFPDGGTAAAPVPAGRDQLLPSSTILDETIGGEQVFALLCASPIDLEPLRRELAADRAPAPPGCAVQRIDLAKRAAE